MSETVHTPFSNAKAEQDGLNTKIRIAKQKSKLANNPDWKKLHPDWCRDAATGNYANLTKVLKEEHTKFIKDKRAREQKYHGHSA